MKGIYAIRDRVANDLVSMQMYNTFAFKTPQQAARYFADAVLDDKSVLNHHPDDYELILCGEITDEGKITALPTPEIIITGGALIATHTKENN